MFIFAWCLVSICLGMDIEKFTLQVHALQSLASMAIWCACILPSLYPNNH